MMLVNCILDNGDINNVITQRGFVNFYEIKFYNNINEDKDYEKTN